MLTYGEFQMQPYLRHLYPSQAKTILQYRAQCLKIKTHRPYQFTNKICRWCHLEEETVQHIVNCGWDENMGVMNMNQIDDIDSEVEAGLIGLATRIAHFLERVDY